MTKHAVLIYTLENLGGIITLETLYQEVFINWYMNKAANQVKRRCIL